MIVVLHSAFSAILQCKGFEPIMNDVEQRFPQLFFPRIEKHLRRSRKNIFTGEYVRLTKEI